MKLNRINNSVIISKCCKIFILFSMLFQNENIISQVDSINKSTKGILADTLNKNHLLLNRIDFLSIDNLLGWKINIGNRIIIPTQHKYYETIRCKNSFHCPYGEFKSTSQVTFINPYFNIENQKKIKKNFNYGWSFGFQYFELKNKKIGYYYDPNFHNTYRGKINTSFRELDLTLSVNTLFEIIQNDRFILLYKPYCQVDFYLYSHFDIFSDLVDDKDLRTVGSNKTTLYTSATELTFNQELLFGKKISNRTMLFISGWTNIIYFNKTFSQYFKNGKYARYKGGNYIEFVKDYRSSITNLAYFNLNLTLTYILKK